jgi:PST family polysaccharide transporter
MALIYREIGWVSPRLSSALSMLRTGWALFIFRSASGMYQTANAFIFGLFAPPVLVSFYSGAEKIARVILSSIFPITQAVYPRMGHLLVSNPERGARLARLSFAVMLTIGLVLGAAIFLAAPILQRLVLGAGYERAVPVMRVLSLMVPLIALSDVFGVQWMLPLGLDRQAGAIIIGAGLLNIGLAAILAPRFGPVGMAWSVIAAETFVTFGAYIILRLRGLDPLSRKTGDAVRVIPTKEESAFEDITDE